MRHGRASTRSAALPPPLLLPCTPARRRTARTIATMASMADVSTPFTTRMTEEQMVQYRKRKVALISGAPHFCPSLWAQPD